MATIYNHENYEITIDKRSDSVYVSFLDKTFYKLFEYNFLDTDVIQFNMTLDNFYKVILTSFDALIKEDDETATIKINQSSRNINLNIHHKYHLEFKFELSLNQNTDSSLNTKDLCIKKLEQKLNTVQKSYTELEQKFIQLEKFLDEFMELTITDNFIEGQWSITNSYVIKINTTEIELFLVTVTPATFNHQVLNSSTFTVIGQIQQFQSMTLYPKYTDNKCVHYRGNLCRIPILSTNEIIFNRNFQMIKCYTLTINKDIPINNLKYLPFSLTKLIIRNDSIIQYISQLKLPNLETIQLEKLTIQKIHSSISHLKSVKNIRITGCSNFVERDLLLTNGYKFESY
jgi:hypothetical protein